MKKEEKTRLTREKIISAAMNEYGSKGYAGASINAICDTGINKGLVYHNFRTTKELYLTCVKTALDDMTSSIKESMEKEPSMSYIGARMKFFRNHEMEARVFFESSVSPPRELQAEIRKLRRDLDELNLKEFQKILDEYRLRDGVTREDAYEWFTYMQYAYNAAFQIMSNGLQDLSFDELLEQHEKGAMRFLNYMLFGIAERKDN